MKKFLGLIFILLCIPIVHGLEVEQFQADYFIAFQKVVAEYHLTFAQSSSGTFLLPIPADATALSLTQDGKLLPYQRKQQYVTVQLQNASQLEASYVTKTFLEPNSFLTSFKLPFSVQHLEISLTLPEHANLLKSMTETSGSAYPRPSSITTDGISITLTWLREDFRQGEELSLYVLYKEQGGMPWILAALGIVFLILLAGIIFFVRKHAAKAERKEQEEEKGEKEKPAESAMQKPVADILKYLKEDEQQIVNILKQREGQCEQGTLRVITGFSKAKLSSLLSELEDRKIVYREKRGKKNLVFLRE